MAAWIIFFVVRARSRSNVGALGLNHGNRTKDMKVWIDQEACTGAGLCELLEPSVFAIDADGLAVVRDGDATVPPGPGGAVTVAPEAERQVLEASQACPGRCIRIESE